MNSVLTKLNMINNNDLFLSLLKITKTLKGLTAKIPGGEYRGRYGRITAAMLDARWGKIRITCCIQPYCLKSKTGEYLNRKRDARRFWDYKDFYKSICEEIRFE